MGRKRFQADQRADLRGGKFIGLPTVVHKSDAYRSLPVFERAVLTEMLATFNGYNNGKLVVSHRQLADALGNSNYRKISRAVAVLIERGLLDIATESVWKQRRAREYRLTFINSGTAPFVRPATNEYLHWQKNDADDVSARNVQSADDVSARPNDAADDVSARTTEKAPKCVGDLKSSADDVSALISKPYLGPQKRRAKPSNIDPENTGGAFAAQPPCEQCGAGIVSPSKNGLKRFCGEQCRKRAERARANQRKRSVAQAVA